MKICLINNLYKPYNRGGAERIVELLALEFKNKGNDVFIISTKPKNKKDFKKEEKNLYYLKSSYYNLAKLPFFLRIFWHFFDLFDIFTYFKVKKILKKEKPNLIISNNLKGLSLLLPKLFAKEKIKHIHILHDVQLFYPSGLLLFGEENKIKGFFNKIYIFLTRFLIASPDFIISPSKWLLKEHEKLNFFPKSHKFVLQNPIQLKIKNPDAKKAKQNSFTLLYVGQIEAEKGVFLLLDTFKKIHNQKIRLRIIGDGSQKNKLLEKTKKNKNIKYLGKLNSDQVYENMRQANALIVPSLCYENSPTVIYEALANNLPVIASELGGIKDFKKITRIFFFQANNSADLEKKILFLIKNYHKIKNKGLFKINPQKLSIQEYVQNILKIVKA